jgi:membrane dipeptidase
VRAALLLLLASCTTPQPDLARAAAHSPVAPKASLHASALVVDGHNDVPTRLLQGFDLGKSGGHTDLRRMKEGGLTGAFFSIYVPNDAGAVRALELIDVTHTQIERHPELVLATRADDVRRAKREGKIAVLLGIEGGQAIQRSLGALRSFRRMGVRYMSLTHTASHGWADAAGGERKHGGLSPFGEEVVREMQRVGILVDVSHASDETFDDVVRVSTAPIIASHSSARALAAHPRNLTDAQLVAIAKTGGVAMINFYTAFLGGDRLSTLVDHIEHAARVAGQAHVGLGSDFDGAPTLPQGIEGVESLPRITAELEKRGWSEEAIRGVLGGNILRVLDEAEPPR